MRTVLVLMDTLRRDVLSCYNPATDVQTPNLDAFAALWQPPLGKIFRISLPL